MYRKGTGPVVIVVHEIPGITPAVERFANDVVDAGFTVVMPDLVADDEEPFEDRANRTHGRSNYCDRQQSNCRCTGRERLQCLR